MIGVLDTEIVNGFQYAFEQNCLSLFADAYVHINRTLKITTDWEEENISANFFDYIDKSKVAIGLNINISDEYRLYYRKILSGKISAKSAARIDFRLTTNWTQGTKRLEYFVEAKNLIESDCFKKGRTTKLNAKKSQKRYIETGINHFISKKYPQNGCLVGYVLQGDPDKIVQKINIYLRLYNRNAEQLNNADSQIPNLPYSYISSHDIGFQIKHFFLAFYQDAEVKST